MGTGHEEEPSRKPALRGHDGQQLAYPHHTAGTAGRNLQSGGTKPCESIIRCAGVYCGSRCRRHPAYAGSSTYPGTGEKTKIYQASTSELFGLVQEVPQKETTPFYPRSPYGVAKQYGFWITKNYRESYGMFAVNGILFNHESERRGETFVTRKITLAAARIAQGYQDKLYLGNLNSLRDWGYAKDYVECMWLILQHDTPEDFVIATGEYHTVRDFTTLAFNETGVELRWEGEGVNEKGIDTKTGKVLVEVDPKYFRPAEVEQLLGDPTKAKTLLGWNPRKTSFEELVKIMVTHDMAFVKKLYMRAQMDGENTSQTC